MDIENLNGDVLISEFNGRVAKHFPQSNQLLVTYRSDKNTDSDLDKLDKLLSGECEFDMCDTQFNISVGYATAESGAGTVYTVDYVESLTQTDANGSSMSDTEILLFNVINVEQWNA